MTTHDRTFTRYSTELRSAAANAPAASVALFRKSTKKPPKAAAGNYTKHATRSRRSSKKLDKAEALELKNLSKKMRSLAAAA